MNCEVCGTELPAGAMFCGECGRAVTPVAVVEQPAAAPSTVLPPAPPVFGASDTVAIDPIDLAAFEDDLGDENPDDVVDDAPEDQTPEPLVEPGASSWSPEWKAPESDGGDDSSGDIGEPEAGPPEPEFESEPEPASPVLTSAAKVFTDAEDLEQTLIVPRREQGERFVLQFSTGESITVFGSGLLGRNPIPQPGEYFDQLVPISDPGKSVSKTHLEFGQEGGSFWVSDRFSGNGSVIREPESKPRRLTAGKRYRIVRGTRVDIAEQFFIVS